jgi:hypothetical protein
MPSGTVVLKDGSNLPGTASLTNGVASVSVPSPGLGIHSMQATYLGDTNFNPSLSAVLIQRVE